MMARRCTHRKYYAQFVNAEVKKLVKSAIPQFLRSTDPHFNDIPLPLWDQLTDVTRKTIDIKLWKAADSPTQPEGTYLWSLCCNVCILKEAARQLLEDCKVTNKPQLKTNL